MKKATVLIIEDEPANRRLVLDVLQNTGVNILEAENGRQGVDIAMENLPDIILMDIHMPVMDGLEAFKLLRSNPETAKIPVIALTSYAMKGDRKKFLELGFDSYLSKPFDIKALRKLVEAFLTD